MNRSRIARIQGFTLVELLVVIAIIAVLAAILIPTFSGAQKRPYDVANAQCHRAVLTVALPYKTQSGTLPTNTSQLGEDVTEACTQQGVQVRNFFAGLPERTATGDGSIGDYAGGVIFYTWHPSGTGRLVSSIGEGVKMSPRPY